MTINDELHELGQIPDDEDDIGMGDDDVLLRRVRDGSATAPPYVRRGLRRHTWIVEGTSAWAVAAEGVYEEGTSKV